MKSQTTYSKDLKYDLEIVQYYCYNLSVHNEWNDAECEKYIRKIKKMVMSAYRQDLSRVEYNIFEKEFKRMFDETKKERKLRQFGKLVKKINKL